MEQQSTFRWVGSILGEQQRVTIRMNGVNVRSSSRISSNLESESESVNDPRGNDFCYDCTLHKRRAIQKIQKYTTFVLHNNTQKICHTTVASVKGSPVMGSAKKELALERTTMCKDKTLTKLKQSSIRMEIQYVMDTTKFILLTESRDGDHHRRTHQNNSS